MADSFLPLPMRQRWLRERLTPVQVLAFGYLFLALLGTGLLMLPAASVGGYVSPVDALFTATSAVSTTGLIVVDTGTFYTLFGQIVILVLFQIGGLGYMTFVVFVITVLGRGLSYRRGHLMAQSLAIPSIGEARHFIKKVVFFAGLFELAGASLLTLYWWEDFGFWRAAYLGVFHAISAFCTAGFALFADSFMAYRDDLFINTVLSVLSFGGAIGFLVLSDTIVLMRKIARGVWPRRLSTHSKLALLLTVFFITGVTIVFYVAEGRVPAPLATGPRLLTAVFQAISASTTTGFNSVDIGALSTTALFVIIAIMFIGAPSGGTGGGIKSTTFAVMLLVLRAHLGGSQDVNVFRRRLSNAVIARAFSIGLLAALWTVTVITILSYTENFPLPDLIFETLSALGTVGLSTGVTADLSLAGRLLIIVTMLIGRLGPLTVALSLAGKSEPAAYHYAEEDVFVG
jgi:trk system potassium uptake protein